MINKCNLIAVPLVGFFALSVAVSSNAQDSAALATLPYQPLWMMSNPKGLPKKWKHKVSFRITASGKPSPPADLKLHIEFERRKVRLRVSKEGRIRLPQKKAWADGNAKIVANQPKGSLQISCQIYFAGSTDVPAGKWEYRDLMRGMHIAMQSFRAADTMTGQQFDERSMPSLRFKVGDIKGKNPVITIHSEGGKIVYQADKDGQILLPYSGGLYDENPTVDMPGGTSSIEINSDIGQGGADQPAAAVDSKSQ